MLMFALLMVFLIVTSREGRVSRNWSLMQQLRDLLVTSREGRVSRNLLCGGEVRIGCVTSREGRVSRNHDAGYGGADIIRHVPRGACE